MDVLDIRFKNILKAIEHTLAHSSRANSPQKHEQIVEGLLKATIKVKEVYDQYIEGHANATDYGRALIKLAEISLMAVRNLPE